MKSDEFIFKQKRQQEVSITFGPKATVSIEVLFIPLTDGEKNAVLTIRVQGFRNHRGIGKSIFQFKISPLNGTDYLRYAKIVLFSAETSLEWVHPHPLKLGNGCAAPLLRTLHLC